VLSCVSLLKSLEGLAPREESRSKGVVERREGGKGGPLAFTHRHTGLPFWDDVKYNSSSVRTVVSFSVITINPHLITGNDILQMIFIIIGSLDIICQ
jgi:hypothetical protein